MNITIREIAAQAGVTKSTVSKVINNRPGVGEETRKRVRDVLERTGFRPSSTARALARGDTENLALLIPRDAGLSLNGAYWSALVSAIAMEASDRGYNLLILTPGTDHGEEELVNEMVSHRRAEGLIIGLPRLAAPTLSSLAGNGFPFVTVGQFSGWESWAVDVDNAGGSAAMTSHILKQGYRRIAMFGGPENLFHVRERSRGFRETLAAAGLSPAGIRHSGGDQESVGRNLKSLFEESRPDALFVTSGGEVLIRILRAMKSSRLPSDKLGLAVFDDFPFLEHTGPGITAVRQPIEDLGRRAVGMLIPRITGEEIPPGPVILPTEIIRRFSCGEQT